MMALGTSVSALAILRHLKITAATTGEKSVAQYWCRCDSIISAPNDGNKAIRKQIDRLRTARTSPEAKTIKLADLIDNTRSIVAHDRDFAKVYLEEKELLLGVLKEGDASLWARAGALVAVGKKEIME